MGFTVSVTYRNDKSKDWVELSGVAVLPMKRLILMGADVDEGMKIANAITVDGMFFDADGMPVDFRADFFGLTAQQWDWWRAQIWKAAHEETADPEA